MASGLILFSLLLSWFLAGALKAQSIAIDPSFTIGSGSNARNFAVAAQPDGQVIVGGTMALYAGTSVGRIARLSRSGALDAAFNANIGTGAAGQVNVIELDASGRILVGGAFGSFNGQASPGLVRLNSDGTIDPSFNVGAGINTGAVTAIAVRPDGRILVGGSFTAFDGSAAGRIVQLDENGARDAAYVAGAGADNDIYDISLDPEGRVVVAGVFGTFDGQSSPGVARLMSSGDLDPAFSVGTGVDQAVFSCIHQDDGRIILGGLFTTYQGSVAPRIVRLLSDGSIDTGFTTGTGFNSWTYALSLQGDGKILVGGNFTSFNGASANRFLRLNTNGTRDAGFDTGSGFNNWVYGSVWQPDGTITLVGGFTAYSGTACNRVVRLDLGCEQELGLSIRTDAFGAQTSWEITGEGFDYTVCSGSGYASDSDIQVNCCIPNGCFRFRLFDSAGDGMATGGYTLRDGSGERIVDNASRGVFTTESSMPDNGYFCLPMSAQQAIFTSRDKLDWDPTGYVVASPNADVTAQWGVGDQTDDGYEFWFFDPNGSYSMRRFRNHATSDGAGTGATRACHLRLSASGALPQLTLLNLRIRARVNGTNGEWGPACRLMIDPVAALCPYTKLMDIPGNQYYSCGSTRTRSQFVTARPVRGATRYQFEFTNASLGYSSTRTSTGYNLRLNWSSDPLVAGNTYNVRVRHSRDGGVTWCDYGDVCTLTIVASSSMDVQDGAGYMKIIDEELPTLTLWPNPSNGRQVELSLDGFRGEETVQLTVHDLSGKLLHDELLATGAGSAPRTVQFARTLPAGQYILRIAGTKDYVVERLVVAP
jgi:uncharacterized delta-60 repeat protein